MLVYFLICSVYHCNHLSIYYFTVLLRLTLRLLFSQGYLIICLYVLFPVSAGMQAFYEVNLCDADISPTVKTNVVRTYYLAAEEVLWDYAPSGRDLISKVSLTESDRQV